jgi:hypothetical protein
MGISRAKDNMSAPFVEFAPLAVPKVFSDNLKGLNLGGNVPLVQDFHRPLRQGDVIVPQVPDILKIALEVTGNLRHISAEIIVKGLVGHWLSVTLYVYGITKCMKSLKVPISFLSFRAYRPSLQKRYQYPWDRFRAS